jgi:Xaa-Pro aminopeptidase
MTTRLLDSEFDDRLAAVRDRLADTAADAAIFFGASAIEYLTGFHHIQTERPVCLAVSPEQVSITVPRLEVERVGPNPRIESVRSYFDYPGGKPIEVAVEMIEALDAETVAADADGAPGVMGYDGPQLSDFLAVETQDWVSRLRWEKSENEIDLVRESSRWANLGHRYLADHTAVGTHPVTVSQRASMEASRAMLDTLGDQYSVRTRGGGPVHAGYISGEETALPHGHTPNERLSPGDVLITGATANVDGYFSELERTMFVREYTDEQAYYFELMTELQEIAIDAIAPGVPVSEIDEAAVSYAEDQGVVDLLRHHVGHNIGLGAHEPPYLDRGWEAQVEEHGQQGDAEIAPGQIYTIEPGLYTETEGYRHSDTVLVTEEGTETLTYYPRDIESNVVGRE